MRTPQEEEVAQKPERIPPVATADSLGSFELNGLSLYIFLLIFYRSLA